MRRAWDKNFSLLKRPLALPCVCSVHGIQLSHFSGSSHTCVYSVYQALTRLLGKPRRQWKKGMSHVLLLLEKSSLNVWNCIVVHIPVVQLDMLGRTDYILLAIRNATSFQLKYAILTQALIVGRMPGTWYTPLTHTFSVLLISQLMMFKTYSDVSLRVLPRQLLRAQYLHLDLTRA